MVAASPLMNMLVMKDLLDGDNSDSSDDNLLMMMMIVVSVSSTPIYESHFCPF